MPKTVCTRWPKVLTISCPNALIADAADQTALQNKRLKTPNDAYCKARKRIVESEVKSLVQLSGRRLDEVSPKAWLWHDRRVILIDSSTLSMPDSQDNQAVYPQPSTQKKELGFPILKIWVLITLGNGAVLDYAAAPQEEAMPGIMAEPIVGDRPDRIEPRAVKWRAKVRQLKRYQGKAA